MDGSSLRKQLLTRRSLLGSGLMLLPFPLLLGNIYALQHKAGGRYRKLADQNRIHLLPVQPERGTLVDRNGHSIAHDIQTLRLVMVREQCPDPAATLAHLSRLVPMSKAHQERILKELSRNTPFTPVPIFKTLSFPQLVKVQVNLPDLPGLDFIPIALRRYPGGEVFGHLTGYVGVADAETPLAADWPQNFPIGRRGLEKIFDDILRGRPGFRQVEVNAHGRVVREISNKTAVSGHRTKLSLSLPLQEKIWELMGDYVGSVTLMDVASGGLIAAVSKPAFDPNRFVEGFDPKEWNALLTHPGKPLINRVFQGVYSPGSTFKPLVAAAALQEGLTTPDEAITCRGHMDFGDRRFHCWKRHGKMNLERAIAESCDIYFYEMGNRLGVDKMAEYSRIFGLGAPSEIGLPEATGVVPTQKWKKERTGTPWNKGENLITAIGQGFLLTTPLQLCTMTARLAGGHNISANFHGKAPASVPDLPIEPEILAIVRKGMDAVMNTRGGTAYWKRPKGFKMAGKTGTVQVVSKRIEDDVDMADVPYAKRPHGFFVGYAPVEKPRLAVCVALEHAGSGGGAAAPVAAQVLAEARKAGLLG